MAYSLARTAINNRVLQPSNTVQGKPTNSLMKSATVF
jgi:hypothetical protein